MLSQFKIDMSHANPGITLGFNNYGAASTAKSRETTQDKIIHIMNKGYDTIIALTMFLCYFALSANISGNLFAQTKRDWHAEVH